MLVKLYLNLSESDVEDEDPVDVKVVPVADAMDDLIASLKLL